MPLNMSFTSSLISCLVIINYIFRCFLALYTPEKNSWMETIYILFILGIYTNVRWEQLQCKLHFSASLL